VTVTVTARAGTTRLSGTETETRASLALEATVRPRRPLTGSSSPSQSFGIRADSVMSRTLSEPQAVSLSLTPAVTVLFKFESHSGQAAA
jgi:hypothetical protein